MRAINSIALRNFLIALCYRSGILNTPLSSCCFRLPSLLSLFQLREKSLETSIQLAVDFLTSSRQLADAPSIECFEHTAQIFHAFAMFPPVGIGCFHFHRLLPALDLLRQLLRRPRVFRVTLGVVHGDKIRVALPQFYLASVRAQSLLLAEFYELLSIQSVVAGRGLALELLLWLWWLSWVGQGSAQHLGTAGTITEIVFIIFVIVTLLASGRIVWFLGTCPASGAFGRSSVYLLLCRIISPLFPSST
mmetsp:Transcript_7478/g.16320  ORF Transcript_7478/g.16320 Transcript_7478/m.16320 type:complete len:248 (-) Transcript_7478:763-1506(-)